MSLLRRKSPRDSLQNPLMMLQVEIKVTEEIRILKSKTSQLLNLSREVPEKNVAEGQITEEPKTTEQPMVDNLQMVTFGMIRTFGPRAQGNIGLS